jgi:hypothetical protein
MDFKTFPIDNFNIRKLKLIIIIIISEHLWGLGTATHCRPITHRLKKDW